MPPRPSLFSALLRSVPALAALGFAAHASGQTALSATSPFAAAGAPAGAAEKAPAEAFELAGSSVQGSQVTVCILERAKKHSAWIPVGGDADGIHVISFDRARDTAEVTIQGARKQLSMQKALVASSNAPATSKPSAMRAPPRPDPVVSSPPEAAPAPSAAARDQREARMLVSDLLEIGVQQRKAYQDAKLKAASEAPPPPQN